MADRPLAPQRNFLRVGGCIRLKFESSVFATILFGSILIRNNTFQQDYNIIGLMFDAMAFSTT